MKLLFLDLKVCDSSINTDPIDIIQEKLETKDQNTMTNPVKHVFKQPDVRDQAIMTESIEPIFKKPQMKHQKLMTESTKSISNRTETKNKGIVTDECINAKNEPFPFYCSKCEILIQPAPVEQILRVMTAAPPLLSEYFSPPHSPSKYDDLILICLLYMFIYSFILYHHRPYGLC